MLTHCDFCLRSESAKFQMPFINLALVPELEQATRFPHASGISEQPELIPVGTAVSMPTAQRKLGLVTRVVPDQTLMANGHGDSAKVG